jgi:hypothetical protein
MWISFWDPVGFRVRWCDFRPVSSDQRLSSWVMVDALVIIGILAQQLLFCLQQQAFLASGGGARKAVRLLLTLACSHR